MGTLNKLGVFLTELREIIFRRPPRPPVKQKAKNPREPVDWPRTALGIALDVLALGIYLAVLWVLISPLLKKAGYAPGFDVPAHMYVTQRLAQGLRAAGRLPTIDLMWYAGLEITHKLPPLVYIPLTVVYWFTNNAMLASRIFFMMLLGLMGLAMYVVVRFTNGRFNALAAAIVVSLSAAAVDPNWGVIASYTRFFAFTLFPWAIYCAKRLLDGRLVYTWGLTAVIAFMMPSHPMIAALTMIWVSAYAVARLLLERRSIFFLKYFFFAYGLSVFMAFWYVGPYIFEEPVWGTTLPTEVIALYSLKVGEQLHQFGVVFALLLIASLALDFTRQRLAMFLASFFSFVYALGVFGPLIALPRILNLAYPVLSYFAGVISLVYLIFTCRPAITSGKYSWIKQTVMAAATVLLVASALYETTARTDFRSFHTTPVSNDEASMAARLRREKLPGRVMTLSPTFPRYGLEMLVLPLMAKKPSPDGQYAVIAPFYLQKTQFYDDLIKNYISVGREKLRLWDVNYVLVVPARKTQGDKVQHTFAPLLKISGFKEIYNNASFKLYRRPEPVSYLQKLGEQTLIIGRFAPVASALYPDSLVTEKSFYIDDYSLADLKNFPTLLLYGAAYKNQAAAENLLRAYIRGGGVVVVDMQALDEYTFERNKVLFNVNVKRKKAIGTVNFKNTSPNQLGLPELKPISFPPSWEFLYYSNLDHTLVKAAAEGQGYSVVGYKRVGRGKVYFVGGDLLSYGFDKHRQDIDAMLNKLLTGSRIKHPPATAVDTSIKQFSPEKMVFSYSAAHPWPALVSRTFSPHWRAYLAGGRQLAIVKTEGLMQINLPAGKKAVTLRYQPTSIHLVSKILTLVAWMIFFFMVFRWWRLDAEDVVGKDRSEVSYL